MVDDHDLVIDGLRALLEGARGIRVVGTASTAEEGRRKIAATVPDVAIVDTMLPDDNGVELIREVRSKAPQVQCLVLTSVADDESLYRALIAGAAGYLVKSAPCDELVMAVRRVAAGESLIGPEMVEDLRRRRFEVSGRDGLLGQLTGQELRILEMITHGNTNREIGAHLRVSEKTVRNYVSSILSKLGMRNRTEVAVYLARHQLESRYRTRTA